MKYKDILINIAGEWLRTTFEFVSIGQGSHACVINIADRVMVIDDAFLVKNGNIPQEWIKPIIDKLRELTEIGKNI